MSISECSLRKAYVVISTTCGDICGDSHHGLRSPQILVVVYTASSYHHKVFVVILYQIQNHHKVLVVILYKVHIC